MRIFSNAFFLSLCFTISRADDVTAPPSDCTFCREGEEVNAPDRQVTLELPEPFGNATRTCREFENLFPLLSPSCPNVPPLVQFLCLCLPVPVSGPPTDSPTEGEEVTPTPEPSTGSISPSAEPEELCGCQPTQYLFALNFSAPCIPDNDAFGPDGVDNESCRVDAGSDDTIFTFISTVFITEFDQNGNQVNSAFFNGPFEDGQILAYQSIMYNNSELSAPPSGIGMVLRGSNLEGFAVLAQWSVTFTNECDVYPVIEGGETTVGIIIDDVGAISDQYCPVAPVASPTEMPFTPPTDVPATETPTDVPVTETPVAPPTDAPVTDMPVAPPTDAPVTDMPVASPTDAPVSVTEMPVAPPTETSSPSCPPKIMTKKIKGDKGKKEYDGSDVGKKESTGLSDSSDHGEFTGKKDSKDSDKYISKGKWYRKLGSSHSRVLADKPTGHPILCPETGYGKGKGYADDVDQGKKDYDEKYYSDDSGKGVGKKENDEDYDDDSGKGKKEYYSKGYASDDSGNGKKEYVEKEENNDNFDYVKKTPKEDKDKKKKITRKKRGSSRP